MAAVLPVVTSCGGSSAAQADVAMVELPMPVRAPVWSRDTGRLLALAQDTARVVAIDPAGPAAGNGVPVAVSPDLGDVGRNLAVSPTTRQVAYVPQPDRGRVAVVDLATLRPDGTLSAGTAPTELAVDVGSEILYSLSGNGSTVTGVRLGATPRTLPPVDVGVGDDATVDGPERGLGAEFFVAGAAGVALYEGSPVADLVDRIDVPAAAAVGDPIKVSRLYVAEQGSDRLVAVELDPDGDQLVQVAQVSLGAPAQYVGADETRVYVATRDSLVVLASDTFTGFADGAFDVVARIDFRRSLPPALARAPLSGLAVGPETDRVYLTLQGQPYLLSVPKPDL